MRILGNIALLTSIVISLAVLLYLVGQSVVHFRRANSRRVSVALKGLVSLALWVVVSVGMFQVLFLSFYTARNVDRAANEAGIAIRLVIFCSIYALIGLGLALWLRHERQDQPINIFP